MEQTTVTAMTAVTATTEAALASPAPVPLDHPYIVFAREIYIWLVPVMVAVLLVSFLEDGNFVSLRKIWNDILENLQWRAF